MQNYIEILERNIHKFEISAFQHESELYFIFGYLHKLMDDTCALSNRDS